MALIEMKLERLPFPPLTKSHILNCSYHSWHPRYTKCTPKARLIPLSRPFLEYLRADGIVLPEEEESRQDSWSDSDSGVFSSAENVSEAENEGEIIDVSSQWQEIHQLIKATIDELGGKIVPKLNWSAPKDATWISATNSMECTSPNDIYLLLKSSDFITHDLEHAFDDCVDTNTTDAICPGQHSLASTFPHEIPYHLVLRKYFLNNPSLEFRCFVRSRRLIGLCQRDLNHFDFLSTIKDKIQQKIQTFFQETLMDTFPDESFVFDVYMPLPHEKVWLIDINPWAQRTDPLLFSWLELLTMHVPSRQVGQSSHDEVVEEEVGEEVEEEIFSPDFRLVRKDDPEAYSFATPQYSAHKLPRDVVDASCSGGSQLAEFASQWKEALEKRQLDDYSSEEE